MASRLTQRPAPARGQRVQPAQRTPARPGPQEDPQPRIPNDAELVSGQEVSAVMITVAVAAAATAAVADAAAARAVYSAILRVQSAVSSAISVALATDRRSSSSRGSESVGVQAPRCGVVFSVGLRRHHESKSRHVHQLVLTHHPKPLRVELIPTHRPPQVIPFHRADVTGGGAGRSRERGDRAPGTQGVGAGPGPLLGHRAPARHREPPSRPAQLGTDHEGDHRRTHGPSSSRSTPDEDREPEEFRP